MRLALRRNGGLAKGRRRRGGGVWGGVGWSGRCTGVSCTCLTAAGCVCNHPRPQHVWLYVKAAAGRPMRACECRPPPSMDMGNAIDKPERMGRATSTSPQGRQGAAAPQQQPQQQQQQQPMQPMQQQQPMQPMQQQPQQEQQQHLLAPAAPSTRSAAATGTTGADSPRSLGEAWGAQGGGWELGGVLLLQARP